MRAAAETEPVGRDLRDSCAADPGTGAMPGCDSLAAKIDRLFQTTRPPGQSGEYTYEQVAAAIAERGGPTISASYLYLLRRGLRDNPTKRHLEALAGFFNVPVSYFLDPPEPDEEVRLGLLAALRDPRVRALAVTAAGLPDEGLDLLSRMVGLAGDLDRANGGRGRRRGGCPGASGPEPSGAPEPGGRAAELELAYARFALQNGEADEALQRLTGLLADARPDDQVRDQALWLSAHAQQALDHPGEALAILSDLLDRCLDGDCRLPVGQVGERICELAVAAGEPATAADAARRALAGLEERGLGGTAEHLGLARTLMQLHLESGRVLEASALARRILREADRVADPHRQASTYLAASRVAQAAGRVDEAIALAERALGVTRDPADVTARAHLRHVRLQAVACLLRAGDDDRLTEAVDALDGLGADLRDAGGPLDRGRWAVERAVADLRLGRPVAAEVSARCALAHLSGILDVATFQAQLVLGDALRGQDRHAHADAAHEQATRTLGALHGHPGPTWLAAAWRGLGDRWQQRDRADLAAQAYRNALDCAQPGAAAAVAVPVPPSRPVGPGRALRALS